MLRGEKIDIAKQEGHTRGIRAYIHSELDFARITLAISLEDTLLKKAGGVFL